MKLAISQVCSLHARLPQCIEDYAASDCHGLEIWLTSLEQYLLQATMESLRAILDEHRMELPAASFQGGLLVSQGDERAAAWELFRGRLALCQQLRIPTLILACDVPSPLRAGDIERLQVSLRQSAEEAARHDVRLALEFQYNSAFGNNLQTACALVEQTGHPHLGICLDAFHWSVGPSHESDWQALKPQCLFHVQVSDLAGIPRELASDSQRILPGDGDLPLVPLLQYLAAIKYEHWISLEILNPLIWRVPPRQFADVGMTSIRKLLETA